MRLLKMSTSPLISYLRELRNVFWAKTSANNKINDEFRRVESKILVFGAFYNKSIPSDPRLLGRFFMTLDMLLAIDVKPLGRLSPKMTEREKSLSVELITKLQNEIQANISLIVERIFEILKPTNGFRDVPDGQLRSAILKGIKEVEALLGQS